MNVKKNLLPILLLTLYSESKVKEPVLSYLPIEVEKKEKKEQIYKITTYYTPVIKAQEYENYEFCVPFTIYKKGESIKLFIKKQKNQLYVEGFVKVITENKTYIVDHNHNVQPFVKNAINTKLTEGQVACNFLKKGTRLEIKGKIYTVTDKGSGLSNSQIDLFTETYSNKTFYSPVNILE